MKISVIIPSYKPQSYLWECLDSVCAQTFPKEDFEVILVLNGCCEPYDSQIKEYISRHSEMHWNYIQTDKGGVSNARNMALDVVNGEYVTFIDDDDYVSPSYLEEMYGKAFEDTIPLAFSYSFVDGQKEELRPFEYTKAFVQYHSNGKMMAKNVRVYFSGPCMKLIPRSYIGDRRFNPQFRVGEDSLFMFLISDRFKYCDFTSRDAVYYRRIRINSAGTTKRSNKEIVRNTMCMIKEYNRMFFRHPFRYSFKIYFKCILGAFHSILVHAKGMQ